MDDVHQPSDPGSERRSRLFLQHQSMLASYVYALVSDPHDAEDLLHDVSVTILSHPEGPRDPERFPAWCRGVARNVVLHHFRARKVRQEPSERMIAAIEAAYGEADDAGERWTERRRALVRCLGKLGERARDLLILRYVEELTSDEIAARQKRSAGAVRIAIMRIREALLRCLESPVGPGAER